MSSQICCSPAELDLSVVLPAWKEAESLEVLLPKIRETLRALSVSAEIIVVNTESGDNTAEVVAGNDGICLNEPAPGYGFALCRGLSAARGAWVITMDADGSHPAAVIETLWRSRDMADIVIASRYVAGSSTDQPWFRRQLSRILNGVFRRALGISVGDLSSGYRLYRRDVLNGMKLEFVNFAILIEILLEAVRRSAAITEVPLDYRNRHAGQSHVRILAFGKDYLRLLAKARR